MGMFDYLTCDYPLPDGFDPKGIRFQTKDTPQQYLADYLIDEHGNLIELGENTSTIINFHGALEFYTNNISGGSKDGVLTDDGGPVWFATYIALYDRGKLVNIIGEKKIDTTRKIITREEFFKK